MIPTIPIKLDYYFFESIKITANPKYDSDINEITDDMIDLSMNHFIAPEDRILEFIFELSVAKSNADFKKSPYRIAATFHALFTIPVIADEPENQEVVIGRMFIDCFTEAYASLRTSLFQMTASCMNGDWMMPTIDTVEFLKLQTNPEKFN